MSPDLKRRIDEAQNFYTQLLEQRRNRAAGSTDVSAAALRMISDLLVLLRAAGERIERLESELHNK